MSSIFSAYAYEESLLSLSNTMLDKDLFVHVDEVAKLRQIGWRPRGQVCGICKRRVWGPGTGLQIWESWQRKEKDRARRSVEQRRMSIIDGNDAVDENGSGKGKATAKTVDVKSNEEDEEQEEVRTTAQQASAGAIIVFSCRHVFHRFCLDQSQTSDMPDVNATELARNEDGVTQFTFRCPICV